MDITHLEPTERRLLLDALVAKRWRQTRLEDIGFDETEIRDSKEAYRSALAARFVLTGAEPWATENDVHELNMDNGADHPMESQQYRRRNEGSVTFAGWYPGKS